jgi:hypothetical protein
MINLFFKHFLINLKLNSQKTNPKTQNSKNLNRDQVFSDQGLFRSAFFWNSVFVFVDQRSRFSPHQKGDLGELGDLGQQGGRRLLFGAK